MIIYLTRTPMRTDVREKTARFRGHAEPTSRKSKIARMVCFVDWSMSISDIALDDDDNCSLSPSKNSDHDDEDSCTSTYHAHRSCSRYASCNKTKHKCLSTNSACAPRPTLSCGPRRGDLRNVDNKLGYRQKYDGTKWRRICCIPDCLRCLNRGIYFENWLCRKHYLSTIDLLSDSDSSVIIEENRTSPRKIVIHKPSTRPSSQRKIGYSNDSFSLWDASDCSISYSDFLDAVTSWCKTVEHVKNTMVNRGDSFVKIPLVNALLLLTGIAAVMTCIPERRIRRALRSQWTVHPVVPIRSCLPRSLGSRPLLDLDHRRSLNCREVIFNSFANNGMERNGIPSVIIRPVTARSARLE